MNPGTSYAPSYGSAHADLDVHTRHCVYPAPVTPVSMRHQSVDMRDPPVCDINQRLDDLENRREPNRTRQSRRDTVPVACLKPAAVSAPCDDNKETTIWKNRAMREAEAAVKADKETTIWKNRAMRDAEATVKAEKECTIWKNRAMRDANDLRVQTDLTTLWTKRATRDADSLSKAQAQIKTLLEAQA